MWMDRYKWEYSFYFVNLLGVLLKLVFWFCFVHFRNLEHQIFMETEMQETKLLCFLDCLSADFDFWTIGLWGSRGSLLKEGNSSKTQHWTLWKLVCSDVRCATTNKITVTVFKQTLSRPHRGQRAKVHIQSTDIGGDWRAARRRHTHIRTQTLTGCSVGQD